MASRASVDALVVGAGVSGLTTAVILAESGLSVRVVADRPPQQTTSAVAGASWGPYLVGHDKILDWSAVSRAAFVSLAEEYGSGVHLASGMEAYDHMETIPEWAQEVPGFENCDPATVPDGYEGAWRYTIPLIDMSVYLGYLAHRLRRGGIEIEIVPALESLPPLLDTAGAVVNCTGLGARSLVGDPSLTASRGQLTIVENPGITEFFQDNVDDCELTCIFPHGERVVLGGVAQHDDSSMEFDFALERRILERCAKVESRLTGARIVGRRVGLRPQRDEIRVARDDDHPGLIHNYGHGGSGVTLSWGCAIEVLKILRAE